MGNLVSGIGKYGDSLTLSHSLSLALCLSDLLADLPSQSCIDAMNNTTPNLADLTPQVIEHRCLEYCYTKLGRSTGTEGVLRERPFTRKGNYLVLGFERNQVDLFVTTWSKLVTTISVLTKPLQKGWNQCVRPVMINIFERRQVMCFSCHFDSTNISKGLPCLVVFIGHGFISVQ